MTIFTFISLFGGLALFLYGMTEMSAGLEKFSGGALERNLEKFTSNIFKGILLGFIVTALIQSSSATTVLVVGLVNARIIKLRQAVGVLMGANIGTTVTGQITRLLDLDSTSNSILEFFKPTTLAPLVAVIGIVLIMFCSSKNKKIVGQIAMGFGVLFTGLLSMSSSMEPLKESQVFLDILEKLSVYPILGLLAGVVITAIIQSSSASVGMLQALSSTGALTFASTYPIILGQNIGTCVTSLISSFGANKNAKRTAMMHIYFNIIGTLIFLIAIAVLHSFGVFNSIWNIPMSSGSIANFHTIFNVITTVMLIPFACGLEKLAVLTIRDKKTDEEDDVDDANKGIELLDERFLVTPSLALNNSNTTAIKMGTLARKNFHASATLFRNYDEKKTERILEREDMLDRMEDALENYLVKIAERELSDADNRLLTFLLHCGSEFERIGDYSINLLEQVESMRENKLAFSESAQKELKIICDAVEEIIILAVHAFEYIDIEAVQKVEPLEQVIDSIHDLLKSRHIKRLKTGKCIVECGVIFLNLLTNLERIADHCSNIAVYLVGLYFEKEEISRHEYIEELHKNGDDAYQEASAHYEDKYYLPLKSI